VTEVPEWKVPEWLELCWETEAPEAPQSGSPFERAQRIIEMYKKEQIKPNLFKALAWDLAVATLLDD
jgi:hypothetical protein